MAMLFEMKQTVEAGLAKTEGIIAAAESANRPLSDAEEADIKATNAEIDALTPKIQTLERANTLRALNPRGVFPGNATTGRPSAGLSKEYPQAFAAFGASKGREIGAALNEGADSGGGFVVPDLSPRAISYEGRPESAGLAVPTVISGEIIPLPLPTLAAYDLVSVVPTTSNTVYPRQTARSTAAVKAESGTTLNYFGGTDPTIDTVTLGATMMGILNDASWELLQDLPQWFQFLKSSQFAALAVLREYAILLGAQGICQPLLSNVTVGEAAVTADTAGNLLPVAVTLDVLGQLDPSYDNDNTAFLMHRRTGIQLRKQQLASNLFDPYFTRVGTQDYLHGYPIRYSVAMPTLAAGATPVLFGDFKAAYLFGERGGSGVNVKILDQTKAAAGVLQVLAYQRVGGIVLQPNAVQAITLHA